MNVADYATYVYTYVYPEMSKVSLALATIVVVTMLTLRIYDHKLVDRVTLRLQTVISCYDIWVHSFPLWSRAHNKEGNPLCTFIAFQSLTFPIFYAFLNVAIGLNLQLVFIHGINVTKKIEAGYWIGSILLSLLITIPLLANGSLGYSKFNKCFIATEDEHYAKMFEFYASNLVMLLCMAYLLTIVIIVVVKLYRGIGLIKGHQVAMDASNSTEIIKNIRLLASRTLLYPISMVIGNLGIVLSQSAYDLSDIESSELSIFANITGGLLGALNFIAFFCDPTVQHALKTVYLRAFKKQVEPTKTDYNNDVFNLSNVENGSYKDDTTTINSEIDGKTPIEYSKFMKSL